MRAHKARPDDDPTPGDRCKDCGGEITWTGPLASDWDHIVDAVIVDPVVLTVTIGDLPHADPELVRQHIEHVVAYAITVEVPTATAVVEHRSPRELTELVAAVDDAARGDSNDEEIEALQSALDEALTRWPDVERDTDPELCGLCGMRRPAPGHTACSSCA